MKIGERIQMNQHEAEEKKLAEERVQAALSPNQLRGQFGIPDDSDDEDEEDVDKAKGQTSAADWGKKARKRQRKFLADMLEKHEAKLRETQEEEEDKDIAEFLDHD